MAGAPKKEDSTKVVSIRLRKSQIERLKKIME